MPVSVRYLNDSNQECVIRPTPLASINSESNRNAEGKFGTKYTITLRGYLLADQGFPLARRSSDNELFDYFGPSGTFVPAIGNAGPYGSFDVMQSHFFEAGVADNRPQQQHVPFENRLDSMFFKQKVLRELFGRDGQRVEITPINLNEAAVICYPRFIDIQFTDGIYTDLCQYTVQLEADILIDAQDKVDIDGNPISAEHLTEAEIIAAGGRFIEIYSDSWSLEPDDSIGESPDLLRSYRITRNISAVGKDHYPAAGSNGIVPQKIEAWEQARDFVHSRLTDNLDYPNVPSQIGSGLIQLIDTYRGYNHTRTESISIDGGSYSVTENWLIASGVAYENYNMSVSTDLNNSFINVSINGDITGLTDASSSGSIFGGLDSSGLSPYNNALERYYEVSNNAKFGVGSPIFKRVNNTVPVELNSQPKSISLGLDEYNGTISYALEFDNRPVNILSGVLVENLNVNDTYPGDVFAVIPIPGRETGPILQAIGGRTEYRRDFSLDFIVDYTDVPYGTDRNTLLLQKPSLVEPLRSQIFDLIRETSPEKEPGIRKWFVNPPQETWNPKTGAYSLNISWVYELSQ